MPAGPSWRQSPPERRTGELDGSRAGAGDGARPCLGPWRPVRRWATPNRGSPAGPSPFPLPPRPTASLASPSAPMRSSGRRPPAAPSSTREPEGSSTPAWSKSAARGGARRKANARTWTCRRWCRVSSRGVRSPSSGRETPTCSGTDGGAQKASSAATVGRRSPLWPLRGSSATTRWPSRPWSGSAPRRRSSTAASGRTAPGPPRRAATNPAGTWWDWWARAWSVRAPWSSAHSWSRPSRTFRLAVAARRPTGRLRPPCASPSSRKPSAWKPCRVTRKSSRTAAGASSSRAPGPCSSTPSSAGSACASLWSPSCSRSTPGHAEASRSAYAHAVGFRQGVGRLQPEQERLSVEVHAEALADLDLPGVSDLDFSWFARSSRCGGVADGRSCAAGGTRFASTSRAATSPSPCGDLMAASCSWPAARGTGTPIRGRSSGAEPAPLRQTTPRRAARPSRSCRAPT